MLFTLKVFFIILLSLLDLGPGCPFGLRAYAQSQQPTSYRQPHPLNWIHGTPVGEAPGWADDQWIFFEFGHANVWNAPLEMTDKKTGDTYTYEADFEQTTSVLEIGGALSGRIALAMEIPFAHRSGGFLDDFIEDFHDGIGARNFNRHLYDENRHKFSTSTNGEEGYNNRKLNGVSQMKTKLKWWAIKCKNKESHCGVGLSTQLKLPIQNSRYGGTNGKLEAAGLLHIGFPVFSWLDFWGTASYMRLRRDDNMPGWPLLKNHQMYEINFDVALNEKWGILLTARTQSPFLDRRRLTYEDDSTNARERSNNRAASGWNSLVRWQGTESIGVRYRTKNNQTSVIFVEDWGLGNYDAADHIYSNGAADFNVVIQSSWAF